MGASPVIVLFRKVVTLIILLKLAAGLLAAPGELDISFDGHFSFPPPGSLTEGILLPQKDGGLLVGEMDKFLLLDDTGRMTRSWTPVPAPTGPGRGVLSFLQEPDGNVLLNGEANGRGYITRLHPEGDLDPAYFYGAPFFYALAGVQGDGKIIVATYTGFRRLNRDLRWDPGFLFEDPTSSVWSFALQPDGKVLAGGIFATNGVKASRYLVRLREDGRVDETFDAGPTSSSSDLCKGIALQSSGRIIINLSSWSDGRFTNSLIRLQANGAVDPTFLRLDGTTAVRAIAVQPDDKIVITGDFTEVRGVKRHFVARLNADGSLDKSFNPGPGPDASVGRVTLRPDGKLFISGYFENVDDISRPYLARLLGDPPIQGSGLVSVSAVDGIAAEPGEIDDPGVFLISRAGPTNRAMQVTFEVTGTAQAGLDYEALIPDWQVIIPAGDSSVRLTIRPLRDAAKEGVESVVVTLTSASEQVAGELIGYPVDPAWASVTIRDGLESPSLPDHNLTDKFTWRPVFPLAGEQLPKVGTVGIPLAGEPLIGVAGNPARLILAAAKGGLWTTTNGFDFEHAVSGTNLMISRLIHARDFFVALGSLGPEKGILISTNGLDWGIAWVTPTNMVLSDVAYGMEQIIAVGGSAPAGKNVEGFPPRQRGGFRLASSNGSEWSLQQSTNSQLSVVRYGMGRFVTMAFDGGNIEISADGVNWTSEAAASSVPGNPWSGLLPPTTNGIGLHGVGKIAFSNDGKVWTTMAMQSPECLMTFQDSLFDDITSKYVLLGGWFHCSGEGSYYAGTTIWSSRNLQSWNRTELAATPLKSITRWRDAFWAVGDAGAIFTSKDLSEWFSRGTFYSSGASVRSARYLKDRFVVNLVGPSLAPVWTSKDSSIWQPCIALARRTSFAFGNGVFVGVPEYAAEGDVILSEDFKTFSVVHGGFDETYAGDIAFGNGIFVRTVYNIEGEVFFSSSSDGRQWRTSTNTWPSAQVDFSGGVFLGGGTFMSTNGLAWKPISGAGGINKFVYGNGIYVGFRSGNVFTSPGLWTSRDAASWTSRVIPNIYSITDVAFGDGYFVLAVVGLTAKPQLLYSSDGIQWIPETSDLFLNPRVLVHRPGTFTLFGNNGSVFRCFTLPSLKIRPESNHDFELNGPTSSILNLERSDRVGASALWESVGSFTMTNSPVRWQDLGASQRASQFYRAKSP